MKAHCCACDGDDCEKLHINGAFKWCEMHLEGGRVLGIVPRERAPISVKSAQEQPATLPVFQTPSAEVVARLASQGPADVRSAQENLFYQNMAMQAELQRQNLQYQRQLAFSQQQWMGSQSFGSCVNGTNVGLGYGSLHNVVMTGSILGGGWGRYR